MADGKHFVFVHADILKRICSLFLQMISTLKIASSKMPKQSELISSRGHTSLTSNIFARMRERTKLISLFIIQNVGSSVNINEPDLNIPRATE